MQKPFREKKNASLSGVSTRAALVIGIALFALGALSSWLFSRYVLSIDQSGGNVSNAHPIRLGQQGLVNPLLEYTTANNEFSEMRPLSNVFYGRAMSEISDDSASRVGVFFEDLTSARWAGVNQDQTFSPASLLKVPTMMTYFKLAESQPGLLSQTVTYDGSFDDNAREDIKPVKSIQAGNSYTVDDLIRFMIQYSDNNATALLFTTGVTTDEFNKTYTDIGLPVPTSTNDFVSPRMYSRFFRILYNTTYLNATSSEKALEFLTYADFPQGIMSGVPENIPVAEKFGEHEFPDGTKELHDCGIVYHPDRPYILCVMTKGDDFTKLTSVIADISRLAWQKVDGNYR